MAAVTPLDYNKRPLSFAEQVALLQPRGLAISDAPSAAASLSRISYYRLSAYWYPFRIADAATGALQSAFVAGTSLKGILDLYEFDRNLRLLVLDALERVEVSVRTAVTYQLRISYGAFGHENPAHFHPKFDHVNWIRCLRDETLRSKDAFVEHFRNRYDGFPVMPIWMTTELISLGTLSRLYKGMARDDKHAVALAFNIHSRRLEDWLHVLTYVRNVCAHHSRLWNRQLAINPKSMQEAEWSPPLLPRRDRLFCVLLVLRYLLEQSGNGTDWRDACNGLLMPVAENPRWRQAMGFPDQWLEHPIWRGV